MALVLLITFLYCVGVWLVFFKFKWLRFSPAWAGQIFKGKVDAIWWASGEGQFLPSDIIPTFEPANPKFPQGQFAVKIDLDSRYKARFPIGAQGGAAIYTSDHGGFVILRRIAIRMNTWFNWLYPMPF